jgi:hypothetical protein
MRQLCYDITPETTEADYCRNVPPLETFAILDHEGWWAQGEMGWFGITRHEQADWPQRFQAYLQCLLQHPEKYVAVVDCHI